MEGARDAHVDCHILPPREEIKIVHLCGFKKGPRAKSSVWQSPAQCGDTVSESDTCLMAQAASRAVRSLSPESGCGGGLCTVGSVARASASVSKPSSPGDFIFFFPNVSKVGSSPLVFRSTSPPLPAPRPVPPRVPRFSRPCSRAIRLSFSMFQDVV